MRGREHVPVRSCTGCGERAPQRDLVRFVSRGADLDLDLHRATSGRGAYLHPRAACWDRFIARKPPLRSLRRSVDRRRREELVERLRQAATRG